MRYVIIGNSAAAVGAVEAIRREDRKGEITIIGAESHHVYSRPLISYLLLGKTDRERMKYRPDGFYEENGCKTYFSTRVTSIDTAAKTVSTDTGLTVPYDKLLVATGSRPFVPPMTGLDSVKNKYTFSCLDDANALEKAINKTSRVLIIGAGLIGLKCAEGISERAGSITVIDLAPKVLSSILDDEAAAFMKKKLESHGMKFFLGDSVDKFTESHAVLKSGAELDFDVLVLAVGVRPNTSLVKDAGGNVGRGITIDDHCRTSIPDVYAAGDCTESADASTGDIKIMALMPNAYMQGECAGDNMTGEDKIFNTAIPMNAIGFFGYHIITAGSYQGDFYIHREGENYKKLFYSNNKLNGFILMGDIDRAGIYTSLVRERTPLDSIDFELICEKPGLMAFSREVRREELGGGK